MPKKYNVVKRPQTQVAKPINRGNKNTNFGFIMPVEAINPNAYLRTGRKDDRNIIGSATREITFRNPDNSYFCVRERHDFINTGKNTRVRTRR